jgi:UDP:flavonoid glycosyltransferase YjiC (YdhE family)
VPLIGIPLQPEQDANVCLAQHQGAARLVAQRDAGTDAMTSAARELLADTSYRTNAARIARIYAAADGPGAAADAIIELASTSADSLPGARRPISRPGFDRALV